MVNAVSQRLVPYTIWCPVKMVTIISDVDVSDVEGAEQKKKEKKNEN